MNDAMGKIKEIITQAHMAGQKAVDNCDASYSDAEAYWQAWVISNANGLKG